MLYSQISLTKDDAKYNFCMSLTGPAWMVQVCPLLVRKLIFFYWPAFLGRDRFTLQRISWFWQYIDQSDLKYYANLNNPIHTLCKGNYNFLVETNGSVTEECKFIVQILKKKYFGWALIPLLSAPFLVSWGADQVQMSLCWTEDGCGCWDAGALGKEFLVGEPADKGVAGGWIIKLDMAQII